MEYCDTNTLIFTHKVGQINKSRLHLILPKLADKIGYNVVKSLRGKASNRWKKAESDRAKTLETDKHARTTTNARDAHIHTRTHIQTFAYRKVCYLRVDVKNGSRILSLG